MKPVHSQAVTLDNFDYHSLILAPLLRTVPLIGLDIETAQPRAHDGIKAFNTGKKLVFDLKRTDLCGISIYPQGNDTAYYFNVGHADVAGRIPWHLIERLLAEKPPASRWVVHNAMFERTMLEETVGWVMENYICTMQMAVSAYGPDEYDQDVFADRDLGDIQKLIPDIRETCKRMEDTSAVQKLLQKVIAKESDAAHSYNGYVKQMRYGYGLKEAVQAFFGHQMTTYKDALMVFDHMGELSTEQVAAYGCEDSVWCVRLFERLLKFMMDSNPLVVGTCFRQELPMVEVYSEMWRHGCRINHQAVIDKQLGLRVQFATATVTLKSAILKLLPFPDEPNLGLFTREPWYAKNYQSFRDKIEAWARSPNSNDPLTQALQLGGAIPAAWAAESGVVKKHTGVNLTHYMVARTIIYDLFQREKPLMEQGKVQSDAEARGRLKETLIEEGNTAAAAILTEMGKLGTIEQAERLYISPYLKLVDPDTSKLHPVMSSMLATRRMAMNDPNATQLAKRGESVYVRGFFLADYDDHVIVSIDWSQIELVLFGEFSDDPVLARCYSTIPYEDVHTIATAACLGVSEDEIKRLRAHDPNVSPHLLVNPKGEPLALEKAFSYWRTEVGKGSNFEFIYSGLLYNLGNKLGWSSEKMFETTNAYAERFATASAWRQEIISEVKVFGAITLPDNHRRVRFEATPTWARMFKNKWMRWREYPEVMWFVDQAIRRIQTRAGNQTVNAKIQGSSATLTKRSLYGIRDELRHRQWSNRDARLMYSVHDEIVASVHRTKVTEYIQLARGIMMNHPSIIRKLLIDCTPSIGITYQPWHPTSAPSGQIELFEAPAIPCVPREYVGKRLPDHLWAGVVDHLFAVS